MKERRKSSIGYVSMSFKVSIKIKTSRKVLRIGHVELGKENKGRKQKEKTEKERKERKKTENERK